MNRYLPLTLLLFLVSPIPVLAIGEYYNPIYVDISPTQSTQNISTRNKLKAQYGSSAFAGCYPCAYTDTSNPFVETSCLQQTEYCLAQKEKMNTETCSPGFVELNNQCVTIDDGCKKTRGVHSYYRGVKDDLGNYSCGCETGFKWNEDVTYCIQDNSEEEHRLADDKTCKTFYDTNSRYVGNNSDGTVRCECNSGYEWYNSTCVVSKQVPTPQQYTPPPQLNSTKETEKVAVPSSSVTVEDEVVVKVVEEEVSSDSDTSKDANDEVALDSSDTPKESRIQRFFRGIRDTFNHFFHRLSLR